MPLNIIIYPKNTFHTLARFICCRICNRTHAPHIAHGIRSPTRNPNRYIFSLRCVWMYYTGIVCCALGSASLCVQRYRDSFNKIADRVRRRIPRKKKDSPSSPHRAYKAHLHVRTVVILVKFSYDFASNDPSSCSCFVYLFSCIPFYPRVCPPLQETRRELLWCEAHTHRFGKTIQAISLESSFSTERHTAYLGSFVLGEMACSMLMQLQSAFRETRVCVCVFGAWLYRFVCAPFKRLKRFERDRLSHSHASLASTSAFAHSCVYIYLKMNVRLYMPFGSWLLNGTHKSWLDSRARVHTYSAKYKVSLIKFCNLIPAPSTRQRPLHTANTHTPYSPFFIKSELKVLLAARSSRQKVVRHLSHPTSSHTTRTHTPTRAGPLFIDVSLSNEA